MKILLVFLLAVSVNAFSQNHRDDCLDSLEIPESITPNGDALNDVFSIHFPCPPEKFTITIVNRWGQEVYTSDDYNFQWDGTNEKKPMPSEVYFFIIEYTFNGEKSTKNGHLQLIR